jgi:hypothetical protein
MGIALLPANSVDLGSIVQTGRGNLAVVGRRPTRWNAARRVSASYSKLTLGVW